MREVVETLIVLGLLGLLIALRFDAQRFGVGVETFDPFRKISCDPQKLGIVDAEDLMPAAAVAVGLALRKAGDR